MNAGPKRASIACTYCRHRKRRCDAHTPQCRTCRQKGLECKYTEIALQRSDDGHADGRQSRDSRRLEAIESLLREHSEVIETFRHRPDLSTSQSPPTNGHDHTRSDSTRSLSVSNNASFPFSFWTFNHTGLGLSTQDSDETPPLTIPLGHQTSTSNLLVLPQLKCVIGDYPDEFYFRVEDRRPRSAASRSFLAPLHQADDTPFVDREVADIYLDNFFNLEYPFHPFIDRDEIIIMYDEVMSRGLDLDVQSALIFAMLAIGATAADPIDRNAENYSGDALIQQALKILYASWTLSFSGDLEVAQGLVLCAIYFTYTVEPLMAWRLVHMASTNIQQILAQTKDIMSSCNTTRLSWVCFIIESDILAEFHMPRSGIEVLVDRMPFPNYGKTPSPENLFTLAEISARSLLNRIHHTLFFTDSLTIYTGKNLSNLSSTSPPSLNPDASLLRVCGELERQLETWYESLPEAIKPDLAGAPKGNNQVSLLRLRYWSARQIIYRPFVIYVTSQNVEQDIGIPQSVLEMCDMCLSACRMFILSAGYQSSERTPFTYSTAQCLFSCSLVVSIAARSPYLKAFVDDIEMLQQVTIDLLEPWAQNKSSIKYSYDIASSIATKQRFQD